MRFFRLFRWSVQNLRWIIKTLFEANLIVVISDVMILQEDLVQMLPMIGETNAMAEELGKKVSYRYFAMVYCNGRNSSYSTA